MHNHRHSIWICSDQSLNTVCHVYRASEFQTVQLFKFMRPVRVFTREAVSIFLLNHTYEWSGIHNDRCKKGNRLNFYSTGLSERAGAGGQWLAGQTTLVYGISVLEMDRSTASHFHTEGAQWPLLCVHTVPSLWRNAIRHSMHVIPQV